jgi:predicted GH43/DUF377 family glycosyl hydrolase
MASMVEVTRTEHHLTNDSQRQILRPFLPGTLNFGGDQDRLHRIVARALALPDTECQRLLSDLRSRFSHQFADLEGKWLEHFDLARLRIEVPEDLALERRLMVGATLTQAYAYEGAALTNPSIVALGAEQMGRQRFVMSARAIGEGHISSIAFVTGVVDDEGRLTLEDRHPQVSNGARRTTTYDRNAFTSKLTELDLMTDATRRILDLVPPTFTAAELARALDVLLESDIDRLSAEDAVKRVHWLAESNYELRFDDSLPLSEHVISPAAPLESRGMEDARFVRFVDDAGALTYYATYTAFDGTRILPQLIETPDFNTFRMATMTGPAVQHKGMAIFPRKIRGEFVALSRHDQERSYVLRSQEIRAWDNAELVFGPEQDWDLVHTGNCGSPIETDHGWLVITHGVGPMRRYVLGALLLDLDEPHKIIGRLRTPFIEPEGFEAHGYVPNVVYSCGSMVHAGNLITPFGYSDVGIRIAVTPLEDLIAAME